MTGTFSSLNGALSALRYNRVAMDVASGNIANAGTEGYARRQVVGQATGAPAVQAIWSTWPRNAAGDGVEAGGINRMVDPLLDRRSRLEHASLSYGDARAASLARFETALAEPGDNGVAAALTAFKSAWHAVANNPGDDAARSQLLARAQTLTASIQGQDNALSTEWADQRFRADAVVTEINQVASQLADLNESLLSANVSGTEAGTLLDQRDQLALRLAELTGGQVSIQPDTRAFVTVGDQSFVDADGAGTMAVSGPNGATTGTSTSPIEMDGAELNQVSVTIDGQPVPAAGAELSGELGGMLKVMNTDLPEYRAELDAFVSQLVADVNGAHALGKDLDPGTTPRADGTDGVAFFGGSTAADLTVLVTNPDQVAAADPTKGTLDNSVATAMADLPMGGPAYRQLIADFGVQVSAVNQGVTNQSIVVSQVDASRQSISGISIDEEMVHLLAAQRGYEGAARVLTTIDSMLNTLINRMAV